MSKSRPAVQVGSGGLASDLGHGPERAESVRVFRGRSLGAPDVVPGEVHMLPAERGKVSEELVRDILGVVESGNGALKVARVPQDDGGDEEAQTRSAVLLVLVGAVA